MLLLLFLLRLGHRGGQRASVGDPAAICGPTSTEIAGVWTILLWSSAEANEPTSSHTPLLTGPLAVDAAAGPVLDDPGSAWGDM